MASIPIQILSFGGGFNQPITCVVWLASVQLPFGEWAMASKFDQPPAREFVWPAGVPAKIEWPLQGRTEVGVTLFPA